MKPIAILLLSCFFFSSNTLKEVRNSFKNASKSKENAILFHQLVQKSAHLNSNLKQAYTGASEAILSQFGNSVSEKLTLFKLGKTHIENALKSSSNSIEIRLIRLVIQTQSPSFLNYNKAIATDKAIILKKYATLGTALQQLIQNIDQNLNLFTEIERKRLK